jgi:hypothetical protein
MLGEWAIVTRDRETRVRAAVAAGLTKHRIYLITGIDRSAIDRILAATGTAGAVNGDVNGPSHGPCQGPSGGGDDHRHESGAPRRERKAPGHSGGGSGI